MYACICMHARMYMCTIVIVSVHKDKLPKLVASFEHEKATILLVVDRIRKENIPLIKQLPANTWLITESDKYQPSY